MDHVDLHPLGRYVGLELAFCSWKIGLGANIHIFNVQTDKYLCIIFWLIEIIQTTYESQKPLDTWFGCLTFFCFMFAMKRKQNMEEVPYNR